MNVNKNFIDYIATSPLDQFEIRHFLSLDLPILNNLQISLTNIGLYLTLASFLIFILISLPNFNKVITNK